MTAPLNSAVRSSSDKRLFGSRETPVVVALVPGDASRNEVFEWLVSSQVKVGALHLVSVASPEWHGTLPFSGARGLAMVARMHEDMQRRLRVLDAAELPIASRYPSVVVHKHSFCGENLPVLLEMEKRLRADRVVLFSDDSSSASSLTRLARNLMRRCGCVIELVPKKG